MKYGHYFFDGLCHKDCKGKKIFQCRLIAGSDMVDPGWKLAVTLSSITNN